MLNKKIILLSISSLIFSQSLFAQTVIEEKPKKRVAVLSFSANNTDESFARIVRNNIELSLFEQKKFEVLEHDQVDFILQERKQLLSECADEECGTKLGGILSAQYVIMGSVSRLEKYIIQIKVIDVSRKQLIIVEKTEAANEGDLQKVTIDISAKLAEEIEDIGKKGIPVIVSTSFHYVMPLSFLKNKVGPGFGVGLAAYTEDIFLKHLLLGLDIQYLYFNSKTDVTHHANILPVALFAGYRLPVWKLSFIPVIYAGMSYTAVFYYTRYSSSNYSSDSAIEPLAKGGFNIVYTLAESFHIKLSSEYGVIFEKGGRIGFLSFGLGAGMRF
jgi:TolB-like protein